MSLENTSGRGVLSHYNGRSTTSKYGGGQTSKGVIKEATWVFDYNELPTGSTSALDLSIPAYAKIIRSYFEVLVAFTSTSTTTDLTVGFEQADGTDIDVDGLHTAAVLTQTAIATRGNTYLGTGNLVMADMGAAAGELVVIPSAADLLTGRARVVVEYMLEGAGGA